MATVSQPPTPAAAVRTVPWIVIGWFAILFAAVYYGTLSHLVWVWSNDEDMGHGYFVPLVAGYIVWQRRREILALDLKPSWWGVGVILYGIVQSYIGTIGAEQ